MNCKFCQSRLHLVGNFEQRCANCHMEFLIDKGQIFYQIYKLDHPMYHAIHMEVSRNITILFYHERDPYKSRKHLYIKQAYPDIPPDEILTLADRINNLKAFL